MVFEKLVAEAVKDINKVKEHWEDVKTVSLKDNNLHHSVNIIPFPNWIMNKPAINFTILEHIAAFGFQPNELA